MASIQLVDFGDLIDAVKEELKIQDSDTVNTNRIKRIINEVYLQEVVPYTNWKWLQGTAQMKFKEAYYAGTVSVTPQSTTVTLSTPPAVSLGSFKNHFFSTNGLNEIYIIESHVAGSTTVTISSEYLGNLDTAANFKIWNDKLDLSTDCKETITVWHNMHPKPLEAVGKQKFRKLSLMAPKAEGYPHMYYTDDFFDPSISDGEHESDRYRQLKLYPGIYNKPVTITVDYIKQVNALDDLGDEPAMPLEDRIVLKYGALKIAWRSVMNDITNAQISSQEFENKLQRMAGRIEDTHDKPKIQPDAFYVRKRRAGRYRVSGYAADLGGSGGSTYGQQQYLQDVTIAGANITANVTVAAGVTIDGVDISEIENDIASHILAISGAHAASAITNTPSGNLVATNVQSALDELQGDVDSRVKSSDLIAANIPNTPSGNVVATNVQAAINELQTDIDTRALANNPVLTGTVNASDSTTVNLATSNTVSTVNIGTGSGANAITIGAASSTVNVNGTLNTSDLNITVNKGGAAASGALAGLNVEENNVATGYARVSPTRNTWEIKAPNVAGMAIISPDTTDDTVLLANKTQTITGKTISTANNTIQSGSATNGQALLANGAGGTSWGNIPGASLAVTSKTTTYTATTNDDIIEVSSASAWTLTLYSASGNSGKTLYVQKTSSDFNAVTITDGSFTTSVNSQNETVRLYSNGTAWKVLDRKIDNSWISYTPTFSGFGTVTNIAFRYRRVGDVLEVVGSGTAGTVTAAGSITIPSGLTIDSGFGTALKKIGYWTTSDFSAGNMKDFNVVASSSSNTLVNVSVSELTQAFAGLQTVAVNSLIANNLNFSFVFAVPITGWSGN